MFRIESEHPCGWMGVILKKNDKDLRLSLLHLLSADVRHTRSIVKKNYFLSKISDPEKREVQKSHDKCDRKLHSKQENIYHTVTSTVESDE